LPVQFVEAAAGFPKGHLYPAGPDILMKVDDIIETLRFQFPYHPRKIVLECMDLANVRVGLDDGIELFFGQIVYLSIRQLLLYTSY
jgi:hypothetical protein